MDINDNTLIISPCNTLPIETMVISRETTHKTKDLLHLPQPIRVYLPGPLVLKKKQTVIEMGPKWVIHAVNSYKLVLLKKAPVERLSRLCRDQIL